LDRLAVEHDNLRTAIQTFLEEPLLIGRGLRMANCVGLVWSARGHLVEGFSLMKTLLQHPDAETSGDEYCRGLCNASEWAIQLGAVAEAEQLSAQAQRVASAGTDPELLALAAMRASAVDGSHGDGRSALERLDSFDMSDVPEWLQAKFVGERAFASFVLDDLARARLDCEEVVALATRRGDLTTASHFLSNLASIDIADENLEQATKHLEQAHSFATLVGNDISIHSIKTNLALVALRSSDLVTARIRYREALRFCTPNRQLGVTLACLLGLAACSQDQRDDLVIAATLHGFIDASYDDLDTMFDQSERAIRQEDRLRLRNAIGEHDFDAALKRGSQLSFALAMDMARTLR
jgi:hypothetical protein